MRNLLNILFLSLILTPLSSSCDRIKQKGQEVAENTKQKIRNKRNDIEDKIIPRFDSGVPDTKFNKQRFAEFFHFEPTPDVSKIYCYADRMGIDSKYFFSFHCDTSTLNRIIAELDLEKSDHPDNSSSGLWQNLSWWDSAKITTIPPFTRNIEQRMYWYLWYDSSENKVWYMDFDM